MAKKNIYRIGFINQGKIYELYAHHVGSADMLGFVEVSDLLFGEKSSVVLDPSEDSLKSEFKGVRRSYIPLHAIIRIDEVEKRGAAKIIKAEKGAEKVTPFPSAFFPSSNDK